ncbi:hypothetical protein C6P40_000001 [Pichia californica]|uniref:Cell division control protein 50 n=1 Tax=Pichia californica TaxID=460514 RepID=A0A9P7BIB8_9ASCO|nr:hypothetical protein C6P40_000001 [[Candida] californica]
MLTSLRNRFKRQFGDGGADEDDDEELRDRVARKLHSRRPPNTAFRQQRLKSWQPVLTARVVIPLLLLVAVIFIPIGIGIFYTTYSVQLVQVDYSNCDSIATSTMSDIPNKKYKHYFKGNKKSVAQWSYDSSTSVCTIQFEVPEDISGNLFLYYKLTNFYQNHRKYVESYDWQQLRGHAVAYDDISSKCNPMSHRDNKIIYPAGLVANSLFNDTFSNLVNTEDESNNMNFTDIGIAWKSDLSIYKKSQYNVSDIVPPINWIERYPDGYTEDDLEDISTDEHFMNWMKTAALPSFMKLYGKNTNKGNKLIKGTYQIEVTMWYPVTIFGGTKSVIITTSSVVGGRHMGLGICYLVSGGLSILFMMVFLVKQLVSRNKREHAFLDSLNDGHPLSGDSVAIRQVL